MICGNKQHGALKKTRTMTPKICGCATMHLAPLKISPHIYCVRKTEVTGMFKVTDYGRPLCNRERPLNYRKDYRIGTLSKVNNIIYCKNDVLAE